MDVLVSETSSYTDDLGSITGHCSYFPPHCHRTGSGSPLDFLDSLKDNVVREGRVSRAVVPYSFEDVMVSLRLDEHTDEYHDDPFSSHVASSCLESLPWLSWDGMMMLVGMMMVAAGAKMLFCAVKKERQRKHAMERFSINSYVNST